MSTSQAPYPLYSLPGPNAFERDQRYYLGQRKLLDAHSLLAETWDELSFKDIVTRLKVTDKKTAKVYYL